MCFNCALAKHCPYVDPLRKTKLRKRDRKSTHLLHLPAHPALVGAYEDLLEPEGGGVAAEGP